MATTIGMIPTPLAAKQRSGHSLECHPAWQQSWPYLRPRSVRPPFPEGKQAEDGAFFVACSLCVWWPTARDSNPPFTLCPLGEDSTTLTKAAQQFPPKGSRSIHSSLGLAAICWTELGGMLFPYRLPPCATPLIIQVQDCQLEAGVRYSKKSLLEGCLATSHLCELILICRSPIINAKSLLPSS